MHKLKRLITAAIVLTFAVVSVLPAAAQQDTTGSGLSISPTLSEFTLKPGQADKLDINLKNITANKITAQASIADFESDNVSGNPKIITDPNHVSPNSIRKFILGMEDIPLDVGQQKNVTLAIQVPGDAAPGAYFGIIRYKAVPAGQNAPGPGEVSLSASVGTIVLIGVPGNIREQVQLTGLHIYSGTRKGTLFFEKPTKIGVELRNLGNGFVKPFGTVEIRNMTGKEVYTYQLNNTNPRASVLPGSNRILENEIKNIGAIGRYTVTASVSYGSGSQVLTLKKTFWYVPIWLAAIILAVLGLLILFVFRAYRHYRRESKRAYRRKG
ncbi:heme exporter protein CcmD [Candidatus Saccharibacteria bacterium]|nr:heme exporter protein CcmD [Candidatus Saccharibacteria bacterium]